MPHTREYRGKVLPLQTPQAFRDRAHRFRIPNQISAPPRSLIVTASSQIFISLITGMRRAMAILPSSSVVQGRTQGRSWSAAKGLPEVHVLTDIKALRKECLECNVTKPQVFASGWMCLSGECALFWTLNGISCARGSELQLGASDS